MLFSLNLRFRFLSAFHQIAELPEQIERVMWSRRGFGVILDTEHRFFFVAQSLDGSVIEVDMCHFDRIGRVAASIAKLWFCDVISTLPARRFFTG